VDTILDTSTVVVFPEITGHNKSTAVITSPRMTTSRISEKSSPTQPSVPATTGKQRICHL
jgi:hypothetical protein